jgi:hypothetical protein
LLRIAVSTRSRRDFARFGDVRGEHSEGHGMTPANSADSATLVQVSLEDFVLVESPLDSQREERFGDFAVKIPIGCEGDVTNQLLSDGAAALFQRAGFQVDPCGARQADDIHAGVLEKIAILGGEDRRHHRPGYMVERHVRAILAGK